MAAGLEEQLTRTTTSKPSSTESRVVPTAKDLAETTYDLTKIQKISNPEHIGRDENKSFQISRETQFLYAGTMATIYRSFLPLNLTEIANPTTESDYANNAIVSFIKNFRESAQLQTPDNQPKPDLSKDDDLRKHALFLLAQSPNKEQWLMTAFTLSQWELMTLQMALRAEINPLKNYSNHIDNPRQALRTSPHGSSQGPLGFGDLPGISLRHPELLIQAGKNGIDALRQHKRLARFIGKGETKTYDIQYYRPGGRPNTSLVVAGENEDLRVDYANPNLDATQKKFILQYFNGQLVPDPANAANMIGEFSDMVVGGSPREPGGLKIRQTEHLLQLMAARDELYFVAGMNTARPPTLARRNGNIFERGESIQDTLTFKHESFKADGTRRVVSIERQANAAMDDVKKNIDKLRKERDEKRTIDSVKNIVDSRLAKHNVKVKSLNEKEEVVEVSEEQDQFDNDYALSESDLKTRTKLEQELLRLKERKEYAEEKEKLEAERIDKEERLRVIMDRHTNDPYFINERQARKKTKEEELGRVKKRISEKNTKIDDYNTMTTTPIISTSGVPIAGGQIAEAYVIPLQKAIDARDELTTKEATLEDEIQKLDGPVTEEEIPEAKDLKTQIGDIVRRLTKLDSEYGDMQPNPTLSSTPLRKLRSVRDYEKEIVAKEKEIREAGPDAYWKEYKRGAYQAAQTLFTGDSQLNIIKAAKQLETADDKAAVVKAMLEVRDPRYKDYPPAYLVTLQMLFGEDIIGPNKFEEFNKAAIILPPDKWMNLVGPTLGINNPDYISHTNTDLFRESSAENITYATVRTIIDALVAEVKTSDRFGLPAENIEQFCEAMRSVEYADIDFTKPPFKQILEGLLKNPDLYYFINEDHLAVLILAVQSSTRNPVSAEEAKTLAREYMRRKRVTGLVTLNKVPPSSAAPGASASTSSPPPSSPPPTGGAGAVATPPGAGSPPPPPTTPPPPSRPAPAPPGATIDADSGIDILRLASVISAAESLASDNHPGQNHDRVVNKRDSGLYAVFDGAGGAGGDPEAAAIAASKAVEEYDAANPFDASKTSVDEYFKGMLQDANVRVAAEGEKGTTTASIVKVFETPSGLEAGIMHRGDSRVYLIRNGKLTQVTEDHSILGYGLPFVKREIEAVLSRDKIPYNKQDIDKLTEDEIKNRFERFDYLSQGGGFTDDIDRAVFELRNWISSFIDGSKRPVKTFTSTFKVEKGDQLLITCDGVHDNLTYDEISAIMNDRTLTADQKAKKLTGDAHTRSQDNTIRSKPDDISAVVVAV